MPQPDQNDFPAYFSKYISKVGSASVADAVRDHAAALAEFYSGLPEGKAMYAYAPGKWTVKEALQHVIDTERVFAYRMVCIARRDKTPLPSFDENEYAAHSGANERSLASLKEEFLAVRKSTDLLIASLTDEQLAEQGTASGKPVTANAVGFIIFGHLLHHKEIFLERYL